MFWGHNMLVVFTPHILYPYVIITQYIKNHEHFFTVLLHISWVIRPMGTNSSVYGSSSTPRSNISGFYADPEQILAYMDLFECLFYTFL